MRFLHKDVAPVQAFLTGSSCEIRRLERDLNPSTEGYAFLPWTIKRWPARPPVVATVAEIETHFRLADRAENAGSVRQDYFHINPPPSDRAVSLNGAVEHVGAFGAPTEFLVVGYHDGGLLSVSWRALPFQDAATSIDEWWRPR